MTGFLHGIEITEITTGTRAVTTPSSAIIGLIGTAPAADADAFPLNQPVAVLSARAAENLGMTGTLPAAIDAIHDQTRAPIIVIRVEEGDDMPATLSNIIGDATAMSGVHGFKGAKSATGLQPRILIAPGFTAIRPQGVSAIEIEDGGTGYTAAPTISFSGNGGGQATAQINDAGAVTSINVTRVGSYDNAPTITIAGGEGSGASATASIGAVANPVIAELNGIAERLRAIIVADGPGTSDVAAIQYAGEFDSSRIYLVEPGVKIWDSATSQAITAPASARTAGAIAKRDAERGFWHSPSNQTLNGIVGISRPIEFAMADTASQSNLLNEQKVACIIRQNGYRLWGNRTLASDPQWTFLSVRRTADMVYEAIEQSFLWAVDKPITTQLIEDIAGSVNAYLRSLKARSALLGGRAWFDPDFNGREELAAGRLTINLDLEPPAPAERITFRAHRNNGYYSELAAKAAQIT